MLERLIAEAKESETSWIDAADAFKLHDTYGFPYDLTKELLAEQGLAVDDDGFAELMEEQRTARPHRGRHRARLRGHATSRVQAFAAATPPSRLRRLRDAERDHRRGGDRAAKARRALLKLEDEPVLRRGRRPGLRLGRAALASGDEAEVLDVYRVGGDQVRRGREPTARLPATCRSRRSSTARPATRRCATTPRRTSCTRRCASGSAPTSARRARRCAPTNCASTSPTASRSSPEELRDVEDRVNEWIKASAPVRWLEMERPGGRSARRDGPVRREIRRVGAGGRDRRRLARALRRHPRRQHRRDRHLQGDRRGLERRQRAPHRGDHRPGRDRLTSATATRRCARRASCSATRRTRSPGRGARPSG